MAGFVHLRGEGGALWRKSLPLSDHLAARVEAGTLEVVDVTPPAAPGDVAGAHPSPPPKAGPGSGRSAWAEYAAALRIQVTDDMDRAAIIAAVEERGA